MSDGLLEGEDGKLRCWWHGNKPDYLLYHDQEWGRPISDDFRLFEKICLEGFQSGLSWLTILRKRENFRSAFDNFDFNKIAVYGEDKVELLLRDSGIIRHAGKIRSTINNARHACTIVEEFGSLASFIWNHEACRTHREKPVDNKTLMTVSITAESTLLSNDLKKRGWTFVGPTTIYSLMQAVGIVNDHLQYCYVYQQVESERLAFIRPK